MWNHDAQADDPSRSVIVALAEAHGLASSSVCFWVGDRQILLGDPVSKTSQSGLVLVTTGTQATMDLIDVGAAVRKDVVTEYGSVQQGFEALCANGKMSRNDCMRQKGRFANGAVTSLYCCTVIF